MPATRRSSPHPRVTRSSSSNCFAANGKNLSAASPARRPPTGVARVATRATLVRRSRAHSRAPTPAPAPPCSVSDDDSYGDSVPMGQRRPLSCMRSSAAASPPTPSAAPAAPAAALPRRSAPQESSVDAHAVPRPTQSGSQSRRPVTAAPSQASTQPRAAARSAPAHPATSESSRRRRSARVAPGSPEPPASRLRASASAAQPSTAPPAATSRAHAVQSQPAISPLAGALKRVQLQGRRTRSGTPGAAARGRSGLQQHAACAATASAAPACGKVTRARARASVASEAASKPAPHAKRASVVPSPHTAQAGKRSTRAATGATGESRQALRARSATAAAGSQSQIDHQAAKQAQAPSGVRPAKRPRSANARPECESKRARKPQRKSLALRFKHASQARVDGQRYRVGDVAFIVGDFDAHEAYRESPYTEAGEAEGGCCHVCGVEERRDCRLITCDYCLREFHEDCVAQGPADGVREGAFWRCGECGAGVPPRRIAQTHAQAFTLLAGALQLVRIEDLWDEGGEARMSARIYYRARDVAAGDDQAQGDACDGGEVPRREVLLSDDVSDMDADLLVAHAKVTSVKRYKPATARDVFVCRAGYLAKTQQRVPLAQVDGAADDGASDAASDFDAESDDSSSSESSDSDSDSDASAEEAAGETPKRRRVASTAPARSGRKLQGGGARCADAEDGYSAAELQVARPDVAGDRPLVAAQKMLTLAARPGHAPCRDEEKQVVREFVLDALRHAKPGAVLPRACLYVAGVPGTGKTTCVREVVRDLQRDAAGGAAPPFRFAEINALRLPSAQHVYSRIADVLTGRKASNAAARNLLENLFSGSGRPARDPTMVLLVDELDMLLSRDQSVLYNLFDWPQSPGARLVVIGIANTADMPERLLPKISRAKVVFAPYSNDQIAEIVRERLAGLPPVFEPFAIKLAARKVSNVSGDVRRALEVLRLAAELAADAGDGGLVTSARVSAAYAAMFEAAHMQVMERAGAVDQVLLASLLLEARYGGKPECTLADVAARAATFWRTRPFAAAAAQAGGSTDAGWGLTRGAWPAAHADGLPAAAVKAAVRRLEACRLVTVGNRAARWFCTLALNVATDDASHVLQKSAKLEWVRPALSA